MQVYNVIYIELLLCCVVLCCVVLCYIDEMGDTQSNIRHKDFRSFVCHAQTTPPVF